MASTYLERDVVADVPALAEPGGRSLSPVAQLGRWAVLVLISTRPRQWVKNIFVLAPLFFTANLHHWPLVQRSLTALLAFCCLSAATYLINDIQDRWRDSLHPGKARRPIAAGDLPPAIAALAALGLYAGSLVLAFTLGWMFMLFALAYVGLMLGYCFGLKRLFLWDAGCISAGFALRGAAGGAAIEVNVSQWLYICTVLVSLFLAFGKRRWELSQLQDLAAAHRPALADYTIPLLDQLVSITTAACLVCYSLYCVLSDTASHHASLLWTAPFVGFGFCRYLHHMYCRGGGGSPEEVLLKDVPFILNGAAYAAVVLVVLYFF